MGVYNPSGSGNVHSDQVMGNGKAMPQAKTIPAKKVKGRKGTAAGSAVKKATKKKS
jgi:hypothetical protein